MGRIAADKAPIDVRVEHRTNTNRKLSLSFENEELKDQVVPSSENSTNALLYTISRFDWILVLPDSEDCPSRELKLLSMSAVPFDIGVELLLPPVSIRFRNRRVFRAPVPEASIHVDSDLLRCEYDVGARLGDTRDYAIHSISESSAVQLTSQRDLTERIALKRLLHPPSHGLRTCPRSSSHTVKCGRRTRPSSIVSFGGTAFPIIVAHAPRLDTAPDAVKSNQSGKNWIRAAS